jgi:energy-coupling factor transporter ATP-binding protein EcfA2
MTAAASALVPPVAPAVAIAAARRRAVAELRALLPHGASSAALASLSTGIAALDAALAKHGVPRGRLTELLGRRGSGKTTLLRELAQATVRRGLGVAVVDAARTLAPRDWASLGKDDGFWVVRPRDPARGAWCADILLRGGAFGLVVLDGAPPLAPAVATRLVRLAHDTNTALVVTGVGDAAPATRLAGALRLRLTRTRQRRRRAIAITVEKGGRRTTVEVEYVVSVARRVCSHPEVPDRRGVERARGGRGAQPATVVAVRPALPRVLSRSRRCAEPEFDERLLGAGVG